MSDDLQYTRIFLPSDGPPIEVRWDPETTEMCVVQAAKSLWSTADYTALDGSQALEGSELKLDLGLSLGMIHPLIRTASGESLPEQPTASFELARAGRLFAASAALDGWIAISTPLERAPDVALEALAFAVVAAILWLWLLSPAVWSVRAGLGLLAIRAVVIGFRELSFGSVPVLTAIRCLLFALAAWRMRHIWARSGTGPEGPLDPSNPFSSGSA